MREKRPIKSAFVGCRFEERQVAKLRAIADRLGEGGSMSVALRLLVEQAPEPDDVQPARISVGVSHG